MFNKYYMFNEDIDLKLKELGFEFDINDLCYKLLCECDLDSTKAMELNIFNDLVSAQRISSSVLGTSRYVKYLSENPTIDEIKNKLEKSMNDMIKNFNRG